MLNKRIDIQQACVGFYDYLVGFVSMVDMCLQVLNKLLTGLHCVSSYNLLPQEKYVGDKYW